MTQGEWIGVAVGAAVGAFILRDLLKIGADVQLGPGSVSGDGTFTREGVAAHEASKQCDCTYGDEVKPCPCDEAAEQLNQLPLGALGASAAAMPADWYSGKWSYDTSTGKWSDVPAGMSGGFLGGASAATGDLRL